MIGRKYRNGKRNKIGGLPLTLLSIMFTISIVWVFSAGRYFNTLYPTTSAYEHGGTVDIVEDASNITKIQEEQTQTRVAQNDDHDDQDEGSVVGDNRDDEEDVSSSFSQNGNGNPDRKSDPVPNNDVQPKLIEPLARSPNATAIQVNNDNMIFEDPKARRFRNHELGSLCEEPSWKKEDNDEDLKHGHDVVDDNGTHGHECSKLRFPLRMSDKNAPPDECWPRLAMIVSFPTSGNFMARMLFSLITGLETGQCGDNGYRETIFDWGGNSHFKVHGQSFCESNLELPYAGRVALLKSHRRPEMHNIIIEDGVLKNQTDFDLPSHIVRLVRNPGDHMIRQATRWSTRDKSNNDYEMFERRARTECDKVFRNILPNFLFHYHKWNEVSELIPSTILHYEEMTNPDVVGGRMREIVNFVGETQRHEVNYTEVVKRPKYEQGSLFKEMCGVEMARKLHNSTKEVADLIGYSFDFEEGVWQLDR